jgi:hypothetical protein
MDPCVVRIYAQPFLLTCGGAPKPRRHVPDFLFVLDDVAVCVVDVKPAVRWVGADRRLSALYAVHVIALCHLDRFRRRGVTEHQK